MPALQIAGDDRVVGATLLRRDSSPALAAGHSLPIRPMRRWIHRFLRLSLALATLACGRDGEHVAVPPADAPSLAAPAASAAHARVRGEAFEILYGGDHVRGMRVDAGQGPGGASGWIELQFAAGGSGVRSVRFRVTCVEVMDGRAWVGVRLPGADAGPEGGGDVWYLEDGGAGAPGRVGVWVGLAPEACTTRPAISWALPPTRGDLRVSAR